MVLGSVSEESEIGLPEERWPAIYFLALDLVSVENAARLRAACPEQNSGRCSEFFETLNY
jgi:hypothetical protein